MNEKKFLEEYNSFKEMLEKDYNSCNFHIELHKTLIKKTQNKLSVLVDVPENKQKIEQLNFTINECEHNITILQNKQKELSLSIAYLDTLENEIKRKIHYGFFASQVYEFGLNELTFYK